MIHIGPGVRLNEKRVTDRLIDYCRVDSAPLKEGALARFVRSQLVELGFSVVEDDAGKTLGGETGNLIARKSGRGHLQSAEPVMFSAHFDRVAGGIGIEPRIVNRSVVSGGDTILGADDASGLAAIVEACMLLNESNQSHRPIELVLTIAEEIGLVGAKHVDVSSLTATTGYVLDADGPVGSIITEAPTKYTVHANFFGRSAHAGIAPEKGISAIKIAATAVSKMRLGRIDADTTANVGYIAGGSATNIIPDRAEIRAEARGLNFDKVTNQVDHMLQAITAAATKHRGREQTNASVDYKGFNLDPSHTVVSHAAHAVKAIGLTPKVVSTGGGSDANVFNNRGLPTVVLGVGFEAIHTFNESMPVDELVRLTALVYAIATV